MFGSAKLTKVQFHATCKSNFAIEALAFFGLKVVPAVLTCFLGISAASGQSEQGSGTAQDLDKAIDVATVAASNFPDGNAQASALVELADALAKAGSIDKARNVAQTAAHVVGTGADATSSVTRLKVAASLGRFRDTPSIEFLVSAVPSAREKAPLLGKFGAELARSGDVAGAMKAASEIRPYLNDEDTDDTLMRAGAPIRDLGQTLVASGAPIMEIGQALAVSGAPDKAATLANWLPDKGFKFRVLEDSALGFCQKHDDADITAGKQITDQIVQATKTMAPAPNETAKPGVMFWPGQVATAGEALAVCDGPEAARQFVHAELQETQATNQLETIANWLITKQAMDLARAVAPMPDPADPSSLLDAANRFIKEGNNEEARDTALQASRVALKATQDSMPRSSWYDHLALLGRIYSALIQVGEYDQALATVQPHDPVNRRQFYVGVEQAAIDAKDRTAVARMLPDTIEALKLPKPDWGTLQQLERLTKALATAGYSEAAHSTFDVAYAVYNDLASAGIPQPGLAGVVLPSRDLTMIAEMQALTGDLQGALRTADSAGSLTAKQSGMPAFMAAMMAGADSRPPASPEQIMSAAQRLAKTLPPVVPGPKAVALHAVVLALAEQGNIEGALQAETGLEADPQNILQCFRDDALASIAAAQSKSGSPHAALGTALRTVCPQPRFRAALSVAATSAQ